jgi:acetylornithine deacetylase/succinyl-diaminopimelate desuccinylase-like protein
MTPESTASRSTPQQEVAQLSGLREVHAAFEWFSAHARELSDRQLELTRIPAPPFGEGPRAEWLRARFVELGLQDVHLDDAGNVLGVRPGATEVAKYVALTAHMDTVFPAETPLDVRRDGDRLLGPGIADNGAGLTALLAIAGALQTSAIHTAMPLLFVANVGEEGEGDLRGIRQLFNDPRWRDAIAYTLVLDGGGTDSVITDALGSRRFEVTVRGPGGHSWTDFGAPNPIVVLAHAIDQFARTSVPTEPKTAFNIGVIEGGTSVNSIPEVASMRVDLRSAATAELDRLEKALQQALLRATSDMKGMGFDSRRFGGISYEMKPIGERPAAQLAPNARIRLVMKAVDEQLGIFSRPLRASTDANIPLSLGLEAVAIGAGGAGGGAHTTGEWYNPAYRELGLRRILLAALTLSGIE